MKTTILVLAALAAPAVATAQSYSYPMTRGELAECMDRDAFMRDKLAGLDRERLANDRETDSIAREGARLADELRTLDSTNARAVASYNARSEAHNRRVQEHNRKVADMNARAGMHNGAAADLTARCATRPYSLPDRDALISR
jgi:hypothetical protein